jgi:malate dehydrogenase (quinone)
VQIIKKDAKKGGVLQFGTELVSAKDGSLAALLGASPGASVTVSIMLELIERCFPEKARGEWAAKLNEIFPAREKILETDAQLYNRINTENNELLELVEKNPATENIA